MQTDMYKENVDTKASGSRVRAIAGIRKTPIKVGKPGHTIGGQWHEGDTVL